MCAKSNQLALVTITANHDDYTSSYVLIRMLVDMCHELIWFDGGGATELERRLPRNQKKKKRVLYAQIDRRVSPNSMVQH